MKTQIFQDIHPDIAISLKDIGLILLYLDDNKKNLKYLKESLELKK